MNIVDLYKILTGQELQSIKNGHEFYGACPFCNDGDDRFRIFLASGSQRIPMFWCRVCGNKGGAARLVMRLRRLNYYQALDFLEEIGYDSTILHLEIADNQKREKHLPPPTKSTECKSSVDMSTIALYHNIYRQKAIDYFGLWGLSAKAIDKHWLGYCPNKNAYTIPHFWIENGQYYIKGLKFRHITNDKKKRFSQVAGGSLSGAWNTEYVSNPDGSRIGPQLSYLFILEAEKDAALMDDLGYPAISWLRDTAWNQHINVVLQNILMPIIVYDVDDKDQGLYSALQLQSYIKSNAPLVSTKAYHIKSPSDLSQRDGVLAIHEWVKSLGLGIT